MSTVALILRAVGTSHRTWLVLNEQRRKLRLRRIRATDHLVDQHSDGAYEVLQFVANCPFTPGDDAVIVAVED